MWTSPAFFHCPHLHPVVTDRSESPPARPQSLQLSNIIVLFIQLRKQRHRATEQPIPSKTQPRMARNYLTRAHTRCLKFLPCEHALHVLSVSLSRAHTPHTPVPCAHTRHTRSTRLLRFTYCHVSPKMTSHCHVSTRQPLTLTIVKNFQPDLSCSVFCVDSDFELHFCI